MTAHSITWSARPAPTGLARWTPIAVALCLGVGLSFAAFFLARSWHTQHLTDMLEQRASIHTDALRRAFDTHLTALHPLSGLFDADGAIAREDFEEIVDQRLAPFPGVVNAEWLPRVVRGQRATYERAERTPANPTYRITEQGRDGQPTAASSRREYYPVRFVRSSQRSGRASRMVTLGFDRASEPGTRRALKMARDVGKTVVISRAAAANEARGSAEFMVFEPVYQRRSLGDTARDRRANLLGFAVTTLHLGDIVEAALAGSARAAGLHIYLFDPAHTVSDRPLYLPASRAGSGGAPILKEGEIRAGQHVARTLDVAGHQLSVLFRPISGPIPGSFGWVVWTILAIGLVVTGLLVSYLRSTMHRTGQVERLLGEVSHANELLTGEMMDRKSAERKFRTLLEAGPEAMLLCDSTGEIKLVNAVTESLFGYGREEMLGQRVEMLIPERFRAGHPGHVGKFTHDAAHRPMGQGWNFMGLTKDGTEIPVDISLGPIEVDGEQMVLSAIRDISDRKAYEDEIIHSRELAEQQAVSLEHLNVDLMKARDGAEAASKAKSNFLAMMNHELRTPLNAIMGFSNIIRSEAMGPIGNESYVEYIGNIHESGQHLLTVIEDILDLSRIETGQLALDDELVDVSDLINGAVRLFKDQAIQDGITLREDVAGHLPPLRGDVRKLKQILASLISNGVKFTERGGEVVVSARVAKNSYMIIKIADTGIGIAPEDIPMALAPFGQVESYMDRPHDGAGRGLPLAKALVELHGGSFDLQSKPGEGTTVTLRMPAERLAAR